ncbi:MAG: tRNA (adenosine(37)-N6)-dimethylallyltransferase MiaA [Geobacteraceae bacterium GWC2_48_7]|nr:MAG: tRNA (adenosine(37)-N6)-dimethylallyltransferase MiaA [Geobacteraceae bacterium GWC2_48_7]
MISTTYNLLVILGPTASGKTALAVALARELGGEIVSADSRQVFRGMDIGTGKDLHEYDGTPHHLIDVLEPGEEFSVFAFQRLFLSAFEDIRQRGALPVLCGGTGMYLDAALRGYRMQEVPVDEQLRKRLAEKSDEELSQLLRELRPDQHNSTDLKDRNRTLRAIEIALYQPDGSTTSQSFPDIKPVVIGIRRERSELRRRITERLRQRLEAGMVEEVRKLHQEDVTWERLDYYGLEYRYIGAYLRGDLDYNTMFQKLNSAIHDFAKRQETWFRRMERNGVVINWVDGDGEPLEEARKLLG